MHNAFKLKKTLEKAPQHLPEGCYKCSQARPGSVKLPLGGVPVARILLLHTQGRPKKQKKANIGIKFPDRPKAKSRKKQNPGLIRLHRSVYLDEKHESITEENAWNSFCAGQDTPRDAKSKHFAKDILKKTLSHA